MLLLLLLLLGVVSVGLSNGTHCGCHARCSDLLCLLPVRLHLVL
jgi:hypothetical protein